MDDVEIILINQAGDKKKKLIKYGSTIAENINTGQSKILILRNNNWTNIWIRL